MALSGTEPWLTADEYLVPVLKDDPFIRKFHSDNDRHNSRSKYIPTEMPSDDWTDSEGVDLSGNEEDAKIKILEKKLTSVRQNFADYRAMVTEKICSTYNLDDNDHDISVKTERDDDTHYFESYEANGM